MQWRLLLLWLFLDVAGYAANDSFEIRGASPEEVAAAMGQLGASGVSGLPPCFGALAGMAQTVSRVSDGTYRVRATALYGAASADGTIAATPEGTKVSLNADVPSEALHRLAVGTPEKVRDRVIAQIRENRRRR